MYERFTERARQVIVLAQAEANERYHPKVTPTHLLVGLVLEDHGIGAKVLRQYGLTQKEARSKLPEKYDYRSDPLSFSTSSSEALERSLREALSLGHNYIGTEHVLLGLLRKDEIRTVLEGFATPEEIRAAVMRELQGNKKIIPHEVKFPVQVGGSKITAERMSGPPSKMYPVLRDLSNSEAEIKIEVDTEQARYQGKLKKSMNASKLWIESGKGPATGLEFSKIIAFRVIEVDKLPAKL